MIDKQIIVTFSDGYCIVLEDNKVSIRENEFTKLSIVVGNRTNELLEFVKNIYLDNKRKEQECEILRMSENEAGEIIAELKAENDTLRQFLSKEPLALQALQSAYSSYKKSTDVFYEMVKQYKQTLAHIKEILLINKRELEECLHNDINGQIMKIISECEGNDD